MFLTDCYSPYIINTFFSTSKLKNDYKYDLYAYIEVYVLIPFILFSYVKQQRKHLLGRIKYDLNNIQSK